MLKKILSNAKCKKWWKAALMRAWHAVWEAAVGMLGASTLITEPNWKLVASASLMAGVLSLAKSFATGLPECGEEESEAVDDLEEDEESGVE